MTAPAISRQDFGTGRTYTITVPEQQVVLPSVTTVLGILGKPALPNWAAKVTREAVAELVRNGASREDMSDQQKIAELFKANGLGHNQKRDDAAARGSGVHDFAQAIADGATGLRAINPYCQAFESWWETTKPTVTSTEMTVYSLADGYAGTADLMTTTDLIDYKTGNSRRVAYDSDFLQTAAYRRAIRQMTGFNPRTAVLILREDGTYQYVTSPDPDADEQAFLSLLQVWRWRQARGFR